MADAPLGRPQQLEQLHRGRRRQKRFPWNPPPSLTEGCLGVGVPLGPSFCQFPGPYLTGDGPAEATSHAGLHEARPNLPARLLAPPPSVRPSYARRKPARRILPTNQEAAWPATNLCPAAARERGKSRVQL